MLKLRPETECRWDIVALGEVLLRFDPGEDRIDAARQFRVFDGGGEYNAARNLAAVFKKRAAIATALTDNALGRLAENLIRQAGVDASLVLWRDAGGDNRNGIYFIERGFGLRAPASCFDRSQTAVSLLAGGDIDWQAIFGSGGTRWFHTGGIFAGLSPTTPEAAIEAARAARQNGAVVSYDLNYRDSLWKTRGGRRAANELNRKILPLADVVFGIPDFTARFSDFDREAFRRAAENLCGEFPNLKIVATTLRQVVSAGRHHLSAACFAEGEVIKATDYTDVQVLDRVGSGDAFAAGMIYGLLEEKGVSYAVECGTALAALTMTTPGDNAAARLGEVEALIGSGAAVAGDVIR